MIGEGGAASITMRELGRRLDVSRAAPYRHFPDKGALLVAVAAAGFESLNRRLEAVGAGTPLSGVQHLRRLGEEYVRFALENPAQYRLMYGREALTRQELPELRAAGNALFEGLVDVIEAHQAAGDIRAGDARTKAYIAWGSVHGLASLLVDGQIMADVDVDGLVREATETVLEGMRP